jgi:hypothetical protein
MSLFQTFLFTSVSLISKLCLQKWQIFDMWLVLWKKNSIRARPLSYRIFKHLWDEINVHCGDLVLQIEVRWLSTGNVSFGSKSLFKKLEFFLGQRWFPSTIKRFSMVSRFYFPQRSYRRIKWVECWAPRRKNDRR